MKNSLFQLTNKKADYSVHRELYHILGHFKNSIWKQKGLNSKLIFSTVIIIKKPFNRDFLQIL